MQLYVEEEHVGAVVQDALQGAVVALAVGNDFDILLMFFELLQQGEARQTLIFNNYGGILADEYCEDVVFNKCKLHDNKGQLFFCYSDIELRNCDVEHHHDDDTSHVIMNNCRVQMDYAEAEELPDVEPEM